MADKVQAWRSDDRSLHYTEKGAVASDLDFLVQSHQPGTADAAGQPLGQWMIDRRADIIRVLTAHDRLHPQPVRGEAPSPAPEGPGKDPVGGKAGDPGFEDLDDTNLRPGTEPLDLAN